MKTSSNILARSPFVLFWLGVLTGALIILGILFFRMYGENYQTSVLKLQSVKKGQMVTPKKKPSSKKYNPVGTVPDTGPAIR